MLQMNKKLFKQAVFISAMFLVSCNAKTTTEKYAGKWKKVGGDPGDTMRITKVNDQVYQYGNHEALLKTEDGQEFLFFSYDDYSSNTRWECKVFSDNNVKDHLVLKIAELPSIEYQRCEN